MQLSIRSTLKATIVASGFFLLHACADEPTGPHADTPSARLVSNAFGVLQDAPAVTMDLPPFPRPWDTSDVALVAALEGEEGHAVVAFKLPSSMRAAEAGGHRAGIPAAAIQQGLDLLERSGVEILHVYRSFGAVSARINPALGPELRGNPLVDYIEPRQWSKLAAAPAGRNALAVMLAAASGQVTPWGISMVRAPLAWSVTTGSGVRVLIIDTGVNPHEDLPAIPSANCGGQFGGCTDGPIFHGTHVAGSFLARNNTIGVVGVAHGIADNLVYAWGACSSTTGDCSNPQIAAGIDAGKFAEVRVISMSLGGPFDQGIANATASAWATGSIVLVAAAGNRPDWQAGGNLVYPAALSNVIGVSGVRTDKSFASSSPCPHPAGGTVASNHGSHVDLSAPFWALSTVGTNGYQDENQGWCGTSMATPHVSGTAALVWAQNPTWTNQQIVNRLFATAEDKGSAGRDDLFGHGIVDAAAAVGAQPPPPTHSAEILGYSWVEPYETCMWQVTSTVPNPTTYEWRVDLNVVGSNSHELWYTNNGSSFNLQVMVSNDDGQYAADIQDITVAYGAGTCTPFLIDP